MAKGLCSRCLVILSEENCALSSLKRRRGHCRKCRREIYKIFREEIHEQCKIYRVAHKEEFDKKREIYRTANREKIKKVWDDWY